MRWIYAINAVWNYIQVLKKMTGVELAFVTWKLTPTVVQRHLTDMEKLK